MADGLRAPLRCIQLFIMRTANKCEIPWHIFLPLPKNGRVDTFVPQGQSDHQSFGVNVVSKVHPEQPLIKGFAKFDAESEQFSLDLNIAPGRQLYGSIVDTKGEGLHGVIVHAINGPIQKIPLRKNSYTFNTPIKTTTDRSGNFNLRIPREATTIGLTFGRSPNPTDLPSPLSLTSLHQIPKACRCSIPAGDEDIGVLQVTVPRRQTIEVTVRDPDGNVQPNVEAFPRILSPYRELEPQRTNDQGIIRILPPSPGEMLSIEFRDDRGRGAELLSHSDQSLKQSVVLHHSDHVNDGDLSRRNLTQNILAWRESSEKAGDARAYASAKLKGQIKLPEGLDASDALAWPTDTIRARFLGRGTVLSTAKPLAAIRPDEEGRIAWPSGPAVIPQWLRPRVGRGSRGILFVSHPRAVIPPISFINAGKGEFIINERLPEESRQMNLKVVDQDGQPIENAIPVVAESRHVIALRGSLDRWNGPRTGSNGTVETMVVADGNVVLAAWAPGYYFLGNPERLPDDGNLTLRMTHRTKVKPELEYPTSPIQGGYDVPLICQNQQNPIRLYQSTRLVRLTIDSNSAVEPLGVALIDLQNIKDGTWSGREKLPWRVDRQSSLVVEAPVGTAVKISGEGLIGCRIPDSTSRHTRQALEAGDGIVEQTVRLIPAGMIRGQLVDGSGQPISDFHVTLHSQQYTTGPRNRRSMQVEQQLVSNRKGTFTFGPVSVESNTIYDLMFSTDDGRYARSSLFRLSTREPIVDLTLTATPGIALTGRLVDSSGDPISGGAIQVNSTFAMGQGRFDTLPKTDRDGQFEITVPPSIIGGALILQLNMRNSSRSIRRIEMDELRWTRDLGTIVMEDF